MIRYVRLFAPYLILLLGIPRLSPVMAGVCHAKAVPFNDALSGAEILSTGLDLLSDDVLHSGDVFLLGTSRTASSFAPPLLEERLNAAYDFAEPVEVVNLRRNGNTPYIAQSILEGINPDAELIIYEFTPRMFAINPGLFREETSQYQQYRSAATIQELYTSGTLNELLGLNNMVYLDFKMLLDHGLPYLLRTGECNGLYYTMRLKNSDAQVYRDEIPVLMGIAADREEGQVIYDAVREPAAPLRADQPYDEEAWALYQEIILRYHAENRIIVVRPSTGVDTYAIENSRFSTVLADALAFFEAHDIPYIDLHPHEFLSMDASHIAWFEVEAETNWLADRIVEVWDGNKD